MSAPTSSKEEPTIMNYDYSAFDLCSDVLNGTKNDAEDLFLLAGSQETVWLELKAACAPDPRQLPSGKENADDYRWHIAKAVISMANTHGGCVILGVNDEGEPIGLKESDSSKLIVNKSMDAFMLTIENRVLLPNHGWRCQKAGHITTNRSLQGLYEIRQGKYRSHEVLLFLVRPCKKPCICNHCGQLTESSCIHCYSETKGHLREFLPTRSLGELGHVEELAKSHDWFTWETAGRFTGMGYRSLFNRFLEKNPEKHISMKGVWLGQYIERCHIFHYKVTISEEQRSGRDLYFEGTSLEGAAPWGPNDASHQIANIKGEYDHDAGRIQFTKTYFGGNTHSIEYSGLRDQDVFKGHWTREPRSRLISLIPRIFRRNAGGFCMLRVPSAWRILITGFQPFGDEPINTSWQTALVLNNMKGILSPHQLYVRELPVDHHAAKTSLENSLTDIKPQICLCLGMSFPKDGNVCLIETVARPPKEFTADGNRLLHGAWPFAELRDSLQNAGVQVETSEQAGRYVCESTYWSLLSFREHTYYPFYAVFLHIPNGIEQETSMSIASGIIDAISRRIADAANYGKNYSKTVNSTSD